MKKLIAATVMGLLVVVLITAGLLAYTRLSSSQSDQQVAASDLSDQAAQPAVPIEPIDPTKDGVTLPNIPTVNSDTVRVEPGDGQTEYIQVTPAAGS